MLSHWQKDNPLLLLVLIAEAVDCITASISVSMPTVIAASTSSNTGKRGVLPSAWLPVGLRHDDFRARNANSDATQVARRATLVHSFLAPLDGPLAELHARFAAWVRDAPLDTEAVAHAAAQTRLPHVMSEFASCGAEPPTGARVMRYAHIEQKKQGFGILSASEAATGMYERGAELDSLFVLHTDGVKSNETSSEVSNETRNEAGKETRHVTSHEVRAGSNERGFEEGAASHGSSSSEGGQVANGSGGRGGVRSFGLWTWWKAGYFNTKLLLRGRCEGCEGSTPSWCCEGFLSLRSLHEDAMQLMLAALRPTSRAASSSQVHVSGLFWYPPGGVREWHTNEFDMEDGLDWRLYLTVIAPSAAHGGATSPTPLQRGASFIYWEADSLRSTATIMATPNRTITLFRLRRGSKHDPLLWHCIKSHDVHRFSLGLALSEEAARYVIAAYSSGGNPSVASGPPPDRESAEPVDEPVTPSPPNVCAPTSPSNVNPPSSATSPSHVVTRDVEAASSHSTAGMLVRGACEAYCLGESCSALNGEDLMEECGGCSIAAACHPGATDFHTLDDIKPPPAPGHSQAPTSNAPPYNTPATVLPPLTSLTAPSPISPSNPLAAWRKHAIADGCEVVDSSRCRPRRLASTLALDGHSLKDVGWQLAGRGDGYLIRIHTLLLHVARRRLQPQPVPLHQICHKGMVDAEWLPTNLSSICGRKFDWRMAGACTDVPGVLIETAQNPCSLRFRMVDGAHRLCRRKCALHQGSKGSAGSMEDAAAPFFVIAETDAQSIIAEDSGALELPPVNAEREVHLYMKNVLSRGGDDDGGDGGGGGGGSDGARRRWLEREVDRSGSGRRWRSDGGIEGGAPQ